MCGRNYEEEAREQAMRDREQERERLEREQREQEATKEVDDFLRQQSKVEKPLEIG